MVTCSQKEEANIHLEAAAAAAAEEERVKEEQEKTEPSPGRRACELVDISGPAHNPKAAIVVRPSTSSGAVGGKKINK